MVTDRARAAFAQWCVGLRRHNGWKQADLAEMIERHRVTIVRYETKKLYPSRDIRIKLNELARETNYPPVPPIR